MNLSLILKYKKIESLTYDSVFLEKPIPDIIDFDYRTILNPPPKNTDDQTLKELEIISRETLKRSNKDVDSVLEIDRDMDQFFEKFLYKYNLEYPREYIDNFYNLIEPILMNTKGFWNRPRPLQLAKLYGINIEAIITETIHSASYPSGHTVYSSLVANIIKDFYPQIDQFKLDKIVNNIARARIIQGVHYPSDNKASMLFTKFIFDKLNLKLKKDYYEQI
jgi:hypothetical protein